MSKKGKAEFPHIDFDTNQKNIIKNFLSLNIKLIDIRNKLGEIIGLEPCFSENYFEELNNALDLIINKCEKQKLFITSHEVKDLLKKHHIEKSNTDDFTKELNTLFLEELTVIMPNYILSYCDAVEEFNFGEAIKCIPTSQIKEQLNQLYSNEVYLNSILECLPSTNYSFCIKIKRCSKGYARILASKNLNVALSLLKIFSNRINNFYEQTHTVTINDVELGFSGYSLYDNRDLEQNALLPRTAESCLLALHGDSAIAMQADLSSSYRILPDTMNELKKFKFNEVCNDIFFDKKPIFQDIKRALDFMTKARIENDYNMKFVFLVSSLESLLPKNEYKRPNEKEPMAITKKLEQLVSSNIRFNNNQDVKKIIKKFNTYRCDIIHSNRNYIATTKYALLRDITEDICLFYIQHSSSHENVDSVFDSILPKPLANQSNRYVRT